MKRRKAGRGFFLTLLTVSGLVIVFLVVVAYQGKEIYLFTYKHFVINKAFMTLLPREYTLEEAEAIRGEIIAFYEAAGENRIGDTALMAVSKKIADIMEDEAVSPSEVDALLALIREKRRGA